MLRVSSAAGEFISIYCTGLGTVSNQPATGAAAQASPLSVTTTIPTVTIGGVAAQVSFSGLTPGAVGLYQVNVQVPMGAPAGDTVPVILSIGGAASNAATIAVQSEARLILNGNRILRERIAHKNSRS
jgi:uncharacterized protein (TIGR03437 family)